MRRQVLIATLMMTVTGVLLAAEQVPVSRVRAGAWTVAARTPGKDMRLRVFARLVPVPDLDQAVLWGNPNPKSEKDWFTVALNLAADQWQPLPPVGKEDWLQNRPKMRNAMRWGESIRLESPEGVLQPVPMCYFNQAAYVPTMKKVLFFVGGKHLAFDPVGRSWEELKPEAGPPHVVWSAMCYDPVNDEVVLFGGGAMCKENRPGTWLFDPKTGKWRRLDQPLAEQPPARCNAPLAYDSKHKLIAVFGGDAQDRYLSDTWVYDCAKRRWRELNTNVNPYPRIAPALCFLARHGVFLMGGSVPGRRVGRISEQTWTLDAGAGAWTRVEGKFPAGFWNSAVYDAGRDRAILYQSPTRYPSATKEVVVWQYRPGPTGVGVPAEGTPAPAEPVTKYHGPARYTRDIEPPGPNAREQFIKALKPNEWTKVKVPRAASSRTWGSATVDTDRAEVIYWGGGHCGYCGTDVSHFSLKTLRWTGSFLPEFPASPYNGFYGDESSFLLPCRSFTGRPWVQHGRVSYAYDPVSGTVVFTQSISNVPTRGWTYIYDPAKRDFVDVFEQPFIPGWSVSGAAVSTPGGVFDYLTRGDHRSGQVGLFKLDVKAREWTNLTNGVASIPCPERNRMVYDGKRDRLVVVSYEGDRRAARPALYAWDLTAEKANWTKLEISGEPPKAFYRESVYIAKHDCILNLNKEGLFACALAAGNRWRNTGIPLPPRTSVNANTAMVYSPGSDLLMLINGRNSGPVPVWLMRFVP